MSIILGIDVGTSSVKCVLTDDSLNVSHKVSVPIAWSMGKNGYSEHDAADWWAKTLEAIKSFPPDIIAQVDYVGIGAQMHGLVCVDSQGEPIRPAIMWNDSRSTAQCAFLKENFAEEIYEQTCNPILPGYTLPKLLWVKDNEPEKFSSVYKVLLPKDYIRYKLTGEFATDYTDASGTGIYDVKKKQWCFDLAQKLGINPNVFPTVLASESVAGKITEQTCEKTGLKAGVLVACGAGDSVCQSRGVGLLSEEQVCIIVGTSGVVTKLTDRIPQSRGDLQYYTIGDAYQVTGCQLNSGSAIEYVRNLFDESDFDAFYDGIDASGVGANKLLCIPYFYSERCPHSDAYARGNFIGMEASHTRHDVARSVIEGVLFAKKRISEMMLCSGTKEVIATGGATKNAVFNAMLADILNCNVRIVKDSDFGGAIGAAIYAAAMHTGKMPVIKSGEHDVVYIPKKENANKYEMIYEIYKNVYENVRVSLKELYEM